MKVVEANHPKSPPPGSVEADLFPGASFAASPEERFYAATVVLPGGYVDEQGIVHREVELAPVTGFEEEFLANVEPRTSSACVVTALLARCIGRVGKLGRIAAPLVRNLLVGDRDFLMLKLREMTFGKRLDAVVYCCDPACGKPMDLTLSLDDFPPETKPVESRFFTLELPVSETGAEAFSIEFKLPTGADQEEAVPLMFVDEESAITKLLARTILRINDETYIEEELIRSLPARIQRRIELQMESLAPQLMIELEMPCVECKREFSMHFDLPSFFFAEMRQGLNSFEREVHFLARHYHWAEREILGLTRRKRRRYIELILEESLGAFAAQENRTGVAS